MTKKWLWLTIGVVAVGLAFQVGWCSVVTDCASDNMSEAHGLIVDQLTQQEAVKERSGSFLAVLKFATIGPRFQYADFISTALTARLKRQGEFQVADSSKVEEMYDNFNLPVDGPLNANVVERAYQSLMASLVVYGTIQPVGDTLVISTQLIDATEFHVISHTQVCISKESLGDSMVQAVPQPIVEPEEVGQPLSTPPGIMVNLDLTDEMADSIVRTYQVQAKMILEKYVELNGGEYVPQKQQPPAQAATSPQWQANWVRIGAWQGPGNVKTQRFSVGWEWRIGYTNPVPGQMLFISLCDANGDLVDMVEITSNTVDKYSYFFKPGVYTLDIMASGTWLVVVDAKR